MEKERRNGDPGQRFHSPGAHPTLCSGKVLETWGHRQEGLICFISTPKSLDTQDLFIVTIGLLKNPPIFQLEIVLYFLKNDLS
jgi:hypothetical protein